MRILGIDAGTEESGWVIYNTETHQIDEKGVNNNDELLVLLRKSTYDKVAFEMIASYGMPVGKTTFQTCLWIGRFFQISTDAKKDPILYYKKIDINPTICFSSKAKDSNIRQAIIDMFPPNGGGKVPQVGLKNNQGDLYGIATHMWAALAVALTYAIKNRLIDRTNLY